MKKMLVRTGAFLLAAVLGMGAMGASSLADYENVTTFDPAYSAVIDPLQEGEEEKNNEDILPFEEPNASQDSQSKDTLIQPEAPQDTLQTGTDTVTLDAQQKNAPVTTAEQYAAEQRAVDSGYFTYATVYLSGGKGSLTMFSGRGTGTHTIGSYVHGTRVQVYTRDATWCYVSVDGNFGYMQTAGLSFANTGGSDPTGGYNDTLTITDGNTHATMYAEANSGAGKLTVIPSGAQVYVIERVGNWARVQYNGYDGYILRQYLTSDAGSSTAASYATVLDVGGMWYVPVYETASINAREITSCTVGTRVRVLRYGNDWCTVQVDGELGYMQTRYLKQDGNDYTGSNAIMYVKAPTTYDKVPLYLDADVYSTQLARYETGKQVRVLQQNGGWSLVNVDSYTGYIETKYLAVTGVATYAVVANQNPKDKLNLREQATIASRSIGRYLNGTQVKVLERSDTWCRVEVEGKQGYMMSMYLSFTNQGGTNPGTTPPTGSTTATVNNKNPGDKLNLRQRATTSSPSIGRYGNGTQVRVTSYSSDWCQVVVGGLTGYMWTQNLLFANSGGTNPTPPSTSRIAVVIPASAYMYESATVSSRILSVHFKNWTVTVLAYNTDWCQVEARGQRGYMRTNDLIMQ